MNELYKKRKSIVEIHKEDLTEDERKNMKVDLNSNKKLADYARYMRNMRKFVQFDLKKKRR